uniref:Glycolipid transfer protein domain containing 2b n=1 Tax=Amphilophus citrinellus TaxID=61819 RepID=A0A3Q0SFG1_AMPCI
MGVKGKAAAAILILLLFLGSLWLREYFCVWVPVSVFEFHAVLLILYNPCLSNSSGGDGAESQLQMCPGQAFQVSLLLSHLLAAPTSKSDVLLQPYLSSWDELMKFMDSLGPMVGLISKEIETKTSIIPELGPDQHSINSVQTQGGTKNKLDQGLVSFHHLTDSGCRTLLRLHRALLWLKLFLEKLAETPAEGRLRSPSDLCREAYKSTLAHHHTWYVRKAAELAFIALPERSFFFRLVCVQNQEELSKLLSRVVQAIEEVYDRTQKALEENGMLDLP